MSTSLKPYETTGIVAGALIVLGACVFAGMALSCKCCKRRRYVPLEEEIEEEPLDPSISSHVNALQMAREMAYQKAVNELEDYFENESKGTEDSVFVRKTLDFLSATLTAIG